MSRRGRTARVASRQRVETLGNGTGAPTNKTIQTAETGELYFIDHNHASALTITLPPMQDGAYFKFIFKTALTADGSVVIATSEATAGSIIGSIFQQVTGGSNANSGVDTDDGTDVKITLSDDIHPGSWVECFCDGSVWHAHARLNVDGVGESGFGEYSSPVVAATRLIATTAGEEYTSGALPLSDTPATNLTTFRDNLTSADKVGGNDFGNTSDMAYGKDGSGNPIWIAIPSHSNNYFYSITPDNVVAKAGWTAVETVALSNGLERRPYALAYGDGVWVATTLVNSTVSGSGDAYLMRSTDSTSWSPVDISSLDVCAGDNGGVNSWHKDTIQGIVADGSGNWWMGVGAKIFKSADAGLNWTLQHTLTIGGDSSSKGCGIKDLTLTNGILVCIYTFNDGTTEETRAIAAPTSDTSTGWGTPVALINITSFASTTLPYTPNGGTLTSGDTASMHENLTGLRISDELHCRLASATTGGVSYVMVLDKNKVLSFTVSVSGGVGVVTLNGKMANLAEFGNTSGTKVLSSIVTDGAGNWYIGSMGPSGGNFGRIFRSTDNGDSWTLSVGAATSPGPGGLGSRIRTLGIDKFLPL